MPGSAHIHAAQEIRSHNSLALNVPGPEAKAGRAFVLKGMIEDVRDSSEVHATAIVEPPKKKEDMAGLEVAESILESSEVQIIPVDRLKEYASDLEKTL